MTLPNEINSATRSLHTRLNALITSRLPLALPPHSSSPDAYLTGIIPFAQVFVAFEKAWEDLSHKSRPPTSSTQPDDVWVDVPLHARGAAQDLENEHSNLVHPPDSDQVSQSYDVAVLPALISLRPRGLARANRVRRDLACLAGIPLDDVDDYLSDHTSDISLSFSQHIRSTVEQKPHVLLAYAFVMYMAIFSGGRWIRSVLTAPGVMFWTSVGALGTSASAGMGVDAAFAPSLAYDKIRTFDKEEQQQLESAGLSFWFWSGLADGLDIKADFRKQLDSINSLLTDEMRSDVISEAREIFIRCEALVAELDERVGRQGQLIKGIATLEQEEYEAEKAVRLETTGLVPANDLSWVHSPRTVMAKWFEPPSYAGWALLFSCLSWYAYYQMDALGRFD